MKRLLFILLISVSVVFSQEADSVLNTQLSDVTITESIRANKNTPVTEKTYTKEQIQLNYYGQEMPKLLSVTPSVQTYSDMGNDYGYSYFRLRGIDQTRINMTLDGIPLNETEDQGVYFNNFSGFANSIENIQIQRGVGTSTNGVASYGGSISYQTNSLSRKFTELRLGMGSYNTQHVSGEVSTGILSNGLAIYGRISGVSSDGYRERSEHKSMSTFFNIGYFFDKSLIKVTAFVGDQQNNMAYLATSEEDMKVDRRMNYLAFNPDEDDRFQYLHSSLQYITEWNKNVSSVASVYYIALKGDYDVWWDGMMNFKLASNFYGGIYNLNYKKDNWVLDGGLHANSYSRDHSMDLESGNIYFNTGHKNEYSAFTKAGYTADRFILYGDVQVRYVKFRYQEDINAGITLDPVDWTFINPKAGIIFNQTHIMSHYFSVGQTSREPTRNDMFNGEDDINKDNIDDIQEVQPEQVLDFELGTKLKFKTSNININLYYMSFTNEIAAIGELSYIGLPLRKNVPSSERHGIELDFTWHLVPDVVILSNNTSYNSSSISEYLTEYDGTKYVNVTPLLSPEWISNTSLLLDFKLVNFFLVGKFVDNSYLDNENTLLLDRYFIADFATTLNLWEASLEFRVNNIFDVDYSSSGYVVGTERHLYAQALQNYLVTLKLRL